MVRYVKSLFFASRAVLYVTATVTSKTKGGLDVAPDRMSSSLVATIAHSTVTQTKQD